MTRAEFREIAVGLLDQVYVMHNWCKATDWKIANYLVKEFPSINVNTAYNWLRGKSKPNKHAVEVIKNQRSKFQ